DGETLAEIPANPEKMIEIPTIKFAQSATLFDNLPKSKKSESIHPMEFFNQGWGSILYRTTIVASSRKRKLTITDVHDWATVFIDGKPIGKLDRRRADKVVEIPPLAANARLDILVEGMGRVNYGKGILDRKGITEKVVLSENGTESTLKNWSVYNFPVDYSFQQKAKYAKQQAVGPAWYKALFDLSETGDTYLDMSKWGKGMVWVNGHNLGRFWRIGPAQTLYLPGCWLKKGRNEIIIFDLDVPQELAVSGINHPILDIILPDESLLNRKKGQNLKLEGVKPVIAGSLPAEQGWKKISFDEMKSGRYFCFEALNSQAENDPVTSVAEIEIIGSDDKPVSSLNWKVLYADSEEVTKANNTADKLFDLQESIIWQTQISGASPKHPHQVVIDMGGIVNVKGFRILPRSDKSNVGMVKDYQFYLEKDPFTF
ncbi:MAG TPA: beta-galactosidase, partial [Paludibacter sp.]